MSCTVRELHIRLSRILVLCAMTSSACADFAMGLEAFNEKDYVRAVMEFTIDARKGNPKAQVNLGMLYENGLGVERDPVEALKLYEQAAESGNTLAQLNLAAMYFEGAVAEPDYEQAAHWYQRAAAAGDGTAQYNLSVMFEEGLGVEVDLVQAWAWLELAARQNTYVSDRERATLTEKLTDDELTQAELLFEHYQQRPTQTESPTND